MFSLIFLSLVSSTFRPDHAVSLGAVAPWYGVPIFEQVLSYFSDFSQDSAKLFLKEILEANAIDNDTYILEKSQSILPSDEFALLQGKIEIGYYLPRTELYRETARSICGSSYPDLFGIGKELLDIQISSQQVEFYEFDLVFGEPHTAVYANLHNSTVSKIILDLIKSDTSFVLRPIGRTNEFGVPLRGFGIEMRPFKYSMEYGVKDSIVLDAASTNSTDVYDKTVTKVKGIPNSYVDVSNIDDFGSLFSGFVRDQAQEGRELIETLRDVTNNYPLFLSDIINSASDTRGYNQVSDLIEPGTTISSINGRKFPLATLDIFTLLNIITEEKNIHNILESTYKLTPEQIIRLLNIDTGGRGGFVLRFDPKYIHYLNDLETDSEYSEWTSSVKSFLFSRERLPQVRKNLVNVFLIIDPSTSRGLSQLYSSTYLIEDQFPVRIGIIPHFTLTNRLSRKVAYAFYHLSYKDDRGAIQFLLDTVKYCGINEETGMLNKPTERHFISSYNNIVKTFDEKCLSWNDLHELYDDESKETKTILETNNYLFNVGIDKETCFLNGREFILYNYGIQGLAYELQRLLGYMQQIVSESDIKTFDEIDFYDLMAYEFSIVPSLDKKILFERPIGIGLIHKTLSQQQMFLDYLSNIEWNYTDEGKIGSFYILFSQNETEINNFIKFSKENHSVPATFVINPEITEPIKNIIELNGKKTLLIANGRLFTKFTYEQLTLIDIWSKRYVYNRISKNLINIKYKRSEILMYLSFLVNDWRSEEIVRRFINPDIFEIDSPLVYTNKNDNEIIHWDIIADPFTREFQRVSDIIHYVSTKNIIDVRLIVVPPPTIKDPILTYYRNSLTEDNVIFTMLNDTTTYSVMPDMPDSWIYESMKATVDLDNILLKELKPSTHEGKYILTNIKAEGTCEDINGEIAEGAELALYDSRDTKISDTIVMMSNGYWQLAANPGIYKIDLGGKRSKMIYKMKTKHIIVSTFAQQQNKLLVSYNKGMEGIKVYNITSKDTTNTTRVDVFSVASGHLYERLLKIMMLAIRRQSKYNVKFWIIKAFLSPQFKATLPIMAKKYNFSYQLVSYKWPNWLRPQFEKQRIIWGNKILFLDVLFPLDLERVIYIDSDQIVRTDLIELMRMDFNGAPYAFTPMCDRKKYHISALFAIDLIKFRQMAAGDWLRYHYQQLSADPNSLANLDQDLPNYAQHHIPIYSLPQNWLWCETWCSDETMDDAKTIDLCNNPLTKRPKLEIAQTRVKEWPGLDEEARNITADQDAYEKYFFPDNK
ncbi:glycosyl transferase [Histomonas meleagridis]|uniref:glycosyl transferase n=1 Tax=Histomonas meleagridis TaxID=135588 RepID=UPI00355A3B94|nr:glycosyl transferase [Histomonas meleagridis]KAH0804123.1 glycosyl transferase [Histomonas meleagridis]